MHLTGGQFKGRVINLPPGHDGLVKPTLSKVRESVFNVLNSCFAPQKSFENLSFLDMFAGSGIMALEAYSRGFKPVFAIEKDYKTFISAKKIYESFGAKISILKGDSAKLINNLEMFDVIYIDPPWGYDYAPIVESALKKLSPGGIIVVEYDNKNRAKPLYQMNGKAFVPFKEKIYGRCKLDFITL